MPGRSLCAVLMVLYVSLNSVGARAAADPLAAGFAQPPDSARPWVYWFWLDGNITREGISADLEAMARVGVGGVLIMEVAQGVPPGPIAFASPEWRELFKHAVTEAKRLGLVVNMNNDAGWCGSGGPWVTPEYAMQRVVFSETRVDGPGRFEGILPQPATVAEYYKDINVLAFPTPPGENLSLAGLKPVITASATLEGAAPDALFDGNPGTVVTLPKPSVSQPQWVQLTLDAPLEARSLAVQFTGEVRRLQTRLQVSEDGVNFKTIREFGLGSTNSTGSFPATTSRIWRLEFTSMDAGTEKLVLAGLDLGPRFRLENVEGKSGQAWQFPGPPTRDASPLGAAAVTPARVVDLSSRMDAGGRLAWDAPAGRWTVVRFGHTPTGRTNAPAPVSGTGLDCDKLSKQAVEEHFNGFLKKIIEDCGPMASGDGAGLTMTHIDSWEVGSQNWSPVMRDEFQRRRGYDPLPWLPVLTGRAVVNAEASERFLWDLRATIGELVADNYAVGLRELSHQHGMTLSIEGYGDCVFDNLVYAGRADVPMSEFWMGGGAMALGKTMSSAAHTYGRPIVAAESFTAAEQDGRWKQHPYSMKALGDQSFCEGVNRFVFHRYAMQPWLNRAPGMTMGPWGVHYERTETWWDWSGPWHAYLSRAQFLLQQGRFFADVCYCIGEGAPNDAPARQGLNPLLPDSYDYDACTAELIQQMEVQDGMVVLPSGMRYRVLVLQTGDRMTPVLLRKIKSLVDAGAVVLGSPPDRSPSLTGYPQCDEEVRQLVAALWDKVPEAEPSIGKGKILQNMTLEKIFAKLALAPDCLTAPRLRYIHRVAGDTDIYFVANAQPFELESLARFRVAGKRPELWWPDTGRMEAVPVFEVKDGRTHVPLRLGPSGSVFVVFRPEAPAADPVVAVTQDGKLVLPATELAPKTVVQRAVYGVPDAPERQRDVRNEVQALIDEGTRRLKVSHLAHAGDPAPDTEKTLVVEYMTGVNTIRVAGQDPDTVEFPDYAPAVVVRKAVYGVLEDPARTRDVRAKAQHLVDLGTYTFQVARMAEGEDPAAGVVKTLILDYEVDGKPVTVKGTDSENISLVTPPTMDMPLVAALHQPVAGDTFLEAWQPGKYEVRTASGKTRSCEIAPPPAPVELAGPWAVSFPPGKGAPAEAAFDQLVSWSEHADPSVRYFSGIATYKKTVNVPGAMLGKGQRIYLDLGKVSIMARVAVNGRDLGILWKPPFRYDITEAAKPGENVLEMQVVNGWPNRLIGDEQLPEDSERHPDGSLKQWPQWLLDNQPSPAGRFTFTTWRLWKKDDPLQESGLLGPVRLFGARVVTLK